MNSPEKQQSDDDCFPGHERPYNCGKGYHNERYCEILNTVRHDVYSRRRCLTSKGVLFHPDNARLHSAKKTLELIEIFG